MVMNANNIITEEMSLEEKLAAIDAAMKTAEVKHQQSNPGAAPLDPADLTMCEGCS